MDRDASQPASSVQIVRRLVAREAPPGSNGDTKFVGPTLQRTCLRVSQTLRDSMGEDGYTALLARALARTEPAHPVLKNIRRINNGSIHLDGVLTSLESNDLATVAAAVEAVLVALVDILIRLIGEDMVVRLIDPAGSQSHIDSARQAP
ncbi:MAG: hypothetical protein ABJF01_21770 [bacterium]